MILTTLLTAAALFGGPTAVLVPGNTSEATAEGVETLRIIVADSLEKAFAKEGEGDHGDPLFGRFGVRSAQRGLVQTLWSSGQTVQHSRAFHLPDVGLILTFDAALPVVPKVATGAAPKDNAKPKDDEWERAQAEVRGGGSHPFVFRTHVGPARESEIDPQAIERTIESVIKSVARHAGRIEGLAPQETITVALRLTGGHQSAWDFDESTTPGEEGEEGAEVDGEGKLRSMTYVLMANDETREQNLVIRLALSDLVNYSDAGYERLRQRAQINRY